MSKELEVLEVFHDLGIFTSSFTKILDENILNTYIKISGKRLTKIKNLYLESYNGEEYKVLENTIYYRLTYDTVSETFIENPVWEFFGVIEWAGKKEDYQPKTKNIPYKKWEKIEKTLKALEIIKKLVKCGYLKWTYRQLSSRGTNDSAGYLITQEENDLLKEVLL